MLLSYFHHCWVAEETSSPLRLVWLLQNVFQLR